MNNLSKVIAVATLLIPLNTNASQISYAPVNPVFQPGNALVGPTLLSIAEAQKKKEPTDTGAQGLTERSIAETVKAAFLSRLTSDLYTNVFCDTPPCAPSGSFDLGDGNLISFLRAGGNVTITFFDPVKGQTVITVPDL